MPRKGYRYPNRPRRDRGNEWSYQKRRRNPTGVMGRPKSTIPLAERRKRARAAYTARLRERGLAVVRLAMPRPAAERLRALAAARGQAEGAVVADLLATMPAPGTAAPACAPITA